MKLAERLRELRKEKNLRQEHLAVALDIGMSTYCRYEQGKREPTASLLVQMADYYDVSVDYLLGRTDNRQLR
ncbi:MAG: helix-turn-helix transcriptional regulator [Clostridiales bacterium]|nr:helix-turn-helix transcriptional regulator [Clostridiales bacterium]